MKHINLSLLIGKMLFVSLFFLTTFASLFASSESEVITTIILIDRQAELVDVDQYGEVLRRHVAVPDYFSSGRSHNSSLRRSLKNVKDYGQIKTDFFIPGSSHLSDEVLQFFLVQSTEEPKKVEGCTLFTYDVQTEGSVVDGSSHVTHGFYGYASFKEEYVKQQTIKSNSKKGSFIFYSKGDAHYRQRTRGHMRFHHGMNSHT